MPDDLTQTATPTPAEREEPQAPVAPRRPAPRTHHGETVDDDYEWLRDKESPEVVAHLAAAGAEAGAAHWVIYHSPVGRDVPGRVEACVPYRGAVVPAGPVVLREDPARTEAYVEVPSRDCRFPQIVGYLDALRVATGLAHATSREVYAVPWSDDPDVVVADVALAVGPGPAR